MAASDSLSNQFGKRLVGHQLDIFGGETPTYSQGRAPKPSQSKEPEFIDVYHASDRMDPPHQIPRSQETDYAGRSTGADDHLFVGDRTTVDDFYRPYIHHYRLPKSSIHPVTYSDDNAYDVNEWKTRTPGHEEAMSNRIGLMETPTLWHSFAASRRSPALLKKAVPYTNLSEGIDIGKEGDERFATSYILPKGHMDELDIKYMGVL